MRRPFCPFVCLRPGISDYIPCRTSMKFGIKFLYKKLSKKLEFCENRLRDSHSLARGINEFLPVLPTFVTHVGKFRYKISPRNVNENFLIS
jgi:hypothetical protein